jgi:hypothetical protein
LVGRGDVEARWRPAYNSADGDDARTEVHVAEKKPQKEKLKLQKRPLGGGSGETEDLPVSDKEAQDVTGGRPAVAPPYVPVKGEM